MFMNRVFHALLSLICSLNTLFDEHLYWRNVHQLDKEICVMCELHFEEIVSRGLKLKHKGKYNGRHRAWGYCHEQFVKARARVASYDKDYLCLHLSVYLTNWGMYRGSSALLFNDYRVHEDAVDIILDQKYNNLWNYNPFDPSNNVSLPQELFDRQNGALWQVYNKMMERTNYPRKKQDFPNASEILVTKVMLGTWGCVPAYDEYLTKALKYLNLPQRFSEKEFYEVVDYFRECPEVFKVINSLPKYTPMKVIDAYLWELGFELSLKDLLQKKIDKYPYVNGVYHYDGKDLMSIDEFSKKSSNEKEILQKKLLKEIEDSLPKEGAKCQCGKVL